VKIDNNFAINLNKTKKVGATHTSGLLQSPDLEKYISPKTLGFI
jgi:iron complex outermembrane receptor protein